MMKPDTADIAWALLELGECLLSKEEMKKLELAIQEWFATHWRDDDNPKAEIRASRETPVETVDRAA